MKFSIVVLLGLCLSVFAGPMTRADAPKDLAPPNGVVVISPGERIELNLTPNGATQIIGRGAVPDPSASGLPTPSLAVEKLQATHMPGQPPKRGTLVASLWSNAADGVKLKVENGYDFPIIYNAALIYVRDGQRRYVPTSICPVRPGQVGMETWGPPVDGIAIFNVRGVAPDHMACTDGSALSLAPEPPKDNISFTCSSGDAAGRISPLRVDLDVDSAGTVRLASATWTLLKGTLLNTPAVMVDYPLQGDVARRTPLGLSVFAVVATKPPPTAKAADIVLSLNGAEIVRRPWRLYARSRAAGDPSKQAVAFAGQIPFFPSEPPASSDAQLAALLSAFGQDGKVLGVRIVGDDGSVLGEASYPIDQSTVHSKLAIDPLLAEAEAKAKTPSQCRKDAH
jgi:hypothetical protein